MITLLAAEGNGPWLAHDINEVIWGSIAFFLVIGLLWWKAGPFLKKALAARPERISGELESAVNARLEAEAERDRIKAALADSDTEAARIVEEAHATAAQLTADLDARAEAEVTFMHERATADLDVARRQSVSDLTREVSRLSLGAAEQVVAANLDDATHQQLIEAYIGQVGSSN